ncbi:MAG: hypothetical protein WDW38_004151 [Sanguina aurantia]
MGTFLDCAALFRRNAVDGDDDDEEDRDAGGLAAVAPYAGGQGNASTGNMGPGVPKQLQQGAVQNATDAAPSSAGNGMFAKYSEMLLHPELLHRGPLLKKLLQLQQDSGVSENYSMEHLERACRYESTRRYSSRRTVLCKKVHANGCLDCRTCHFCRQKSVEVKTSCNCQYTKGVQGGNGRGFWCGACLYLRHGEILSEVRHNPRWHCPACRDICNCSGGTCLRAVRGLEPTKQLAGEAMQLGYRSTAMQSVMAQHEAQVQALRQIIPIHTPILAALQERGLGTHVLELCGNEDDDTYGDMHAGMGRSVQHHDSYPHSNGLRAQQHGGCVQQQHGAEGAQQDGSHAQHQGAQVVQHSGLNDQQDGVYAVQHHGARVQQQQQQQAMGIQAQYRQEGARAQYGGDKVQQDGVGAASHDGVHAQQNCTHANAQQDGVQQTDGGAGGQPPLPAGGFAVAPATAGSAGGAVGGSGGGWDRGRWRFRSQGSRAGSLDGGDVGVPGPWVRHP